MKGLSERSFAVECQLSRGTVRDIEAQDERVSLATLKKAGKALERKIVCLLVPDSNVNSDDSVFSVGLKIMKDGFPSWKVHLFDFVDEFRRTLDPRLLLLPPSVHLEPRLRALMASVTLSLCEEAGTSFPDWAEMPLFLEKPWFLSDSNVLKASALLESPIWFRKNNIFVLDNFLRRV